MARTVRNVLRFRQIPITRMVTWASIRFTAVDITGVLAVAGNIAALGTAFYDGHLVRQYLGLNLLHSVPSIFAQNLLFIFVIGFLDYWIHRLMHRVPWMWEIHKCHHSATKMSVVTARRDSILVVPVATFFKAIPFALLGIPRA